MFCRSVKDLVPVRCEDSVKQNGIGLSPEVEVDRRGQGSQRVIGMFSGKDSDTHYAILLSARAVCRSSFKGQEVEAVGPYVGQRRGGACVFAPLGETGTDPGGLWPVGVCSEVSLHQEAQKHANRGISSIYHYATGTAGGMLYNQG